MSIGQVTARGRTAEVIDAGENEVLKLYNAWVPREAAEREYRITDQVQRSGLQVPRPIRIVTQGERTGIVFERAVGLTMLQVLLRQPWAHRRLAGCFAGAHAEMHTKTVIGLPEQKAVLKANITEAPYLTEAEKASIIVRLEALGDGDKLCHGDFHPDNIMLGSRTWMIDWMTGMTGNPAGDAARTVLLFRFGTLPDATPPYKQALFAIARLRFLALYLKRYTRLSGVSRKEIMAWLVPVGAARLGEGIPEQEKRQIVRMIRAGLDV